MGPVLASAGRPSDGEADVVVLPNGSTLVHHGVVNDSQRRAGLTTSDGEACEPDANFMFCTTHQTASGDWPCSVGSADRAAQIARIAELEAVLSTMDHFADVAEVCERKSNEYAARNAELEADLRGRELHHFETEQRNAELEAEVKRVWRWFETDSHTAPASPVVAPSATDPVEQLRDEAWERFRTKGTPKPSATDEDEPCVCGTGFTCMARNHGQGGE